MAEPTLDSAGVHQLHDVSREEILRHLFGDIGELIDGQENIITFILIYSLYFRQK
jgi:hypothetical protein